MLLAILTCVSLHVAASDPETKPATADKLPEVTALQGGKPRKLSPGLKTRIEGLAVAILADQRVDASAFADKDRWTAALKEENVHIAYDPPRAVAIEPGNVEQVLHVSEILMPMSGDKWPDLILVRADGRYRAFARYQSKYLAPEVVVLQQILQRCKGQ
jgi:hypothetical protein